MPVVSPGWDWTKYMFVIAHMECDFIPKLTLKTVNPIVKTRAVSISNKSFEMEQIITSNATDGSEIVAGKGKSINVMVDVIEKKLPKFLIGYVKI